MDDDDDARAQRQSFAAPAWQRRANVPYITTSAQDGGAYDDLSGYDSSSQLNVGSSPGSSTVSSRNPSRPPSASRPARAGPRAAAAGRGPSRASTRRASRDSGGHERRDARVRAAVALQTASRVVAARRETAPLFRALKRVKAATRLQAPLAARGGVEAARRREYEAYVATLALRFRETRALEKVQSWARREAALRATRRSLLVTGPDRETDPRARGVRGARLGVGAAVDLRVGHGGDAEPRVREPRRPPAVASDETQRTSGAPRSRSGRRAGACP
ncbi:hypothetical protein SO694_00010354 [Aureococcus anophagefferens]|uniref:Uncharacterized protein n=1 Tax=Aureococcus anophagefferens TaxID=44056 RepID=A0ABR1GEX1_AURAN